MKIHAQRNVVPHGFRMNLVELMRRHSLWLGSGTLGPAELAGPVMKFLKDLGVQCMRAPFSSWAQLSYMDLSPNGHFHAIYAGSELLMFKTERIIVNMDFENHVFEWVDKTAILQSLELTEDMFMDMCIIAGFDYCPTFPVLTEPGKPFDFLSAYHCIKQYYCGAIAIQQHSNHFLVKKMDYMEIFLRTRSSIKHHIVFDDNASAVPLYAHLCPSDLQDIFGPRLPDTIYYYLVQGLISPQVINNFVSGVLIEGPPLCNGDTFEYRGFLKSLLPFRTKVINLLSENLSPELANRKVSAFFWFEKGLEHNISIQTDSQTRLNKMIFSDSISKYKEKTQREDMGFVTCLYLVRERLLDSISELKSRKLQTIDEIVMNAELRLLHDRQFIDGEGNRLPFGKALSKCAPRYQNEILVALDLVRAQLLNNKAPRHIDAAENILDGKA